jgi:polyhydroxybutyrate depolymerase
MKWPVILFALSVGVFISCDKDSMPSQNNDLEWVEGFNEFNMEIDGEMRNFLIHVPTSYKGDTITPLLFMLHGSSGNGQRFYNISGWVQKAEEEGFIAVFPTALEYPIVEKNGRMETKWSAGGLEKDIPEGYPIKDDIPFFRKLVDLCKGSFSIDGNRVYICGFSNGGGFVKSRILPEMADVFAACASSGGPGLPQSFPLIGLRRMPLYTIVGTLDDRVIERTGAMEELPLNADEFLAIEQIGNATDTLLNMLQLGSPYSETPNPPAYNLIVFDEDLSGQGNEMRYLLVKGLQHRFPNGTNNPHNLAAVNFLWPWFLNYSLQ